jgi:hypothetical protein
MPVITPLQPLAEPTWIFTFEEEGADCGREVLGRKERTLLSSVR